MTKFDGTGGTSIYGDSFEKENFKLRLTGPGILSMCNNDEGRNDSKFNLTFGRLETADKDRVVFGRVIAGMKNIYKVTLLYIFNDNLKVVSKVALRILIHNYSTVNPIRENSDY